MNAITTHTHNLFPKQTQQARRGFTMIELLVVIALLAILLTLIFKPLFDVFNLTSRAGTQIEAQSAARNTMREVQTTFSNAAYIYDNAQNKINLWVPGFDVGGAPTQVAVPTAYAMAEYVLPSRQYDQAQNLTTDPTTGDPIYSLSDPPAKSGYAMPLTSGRTLGRLFVGLENNASTNGQPTVPYFNAFEEPRVQGKDNRYTLYKAEVQTFIADPNSAGGGKTSYIPNLKLFHSVDPTGKIIDTAANTNGSTASVQLHDPNFFYDDAPAGGSEAGNGTILWAVPGAKPTGPNGTYTLADNWRAVSTTLFLPKKVDAIAVDRNADTYAVVYYDAAGAVVAAKTANAVSHARPLVTFSPYYVENDPGTPSAVENAGNETQNAASVSYQTQYSHWDNPFRVQVFRAPDTTGDPLSQNKFTYYEYDPATGSIVEYANIAPGTSPAAGSGTAMSLTVDPLTGAWTNPADYMKADFFAYTVDSRAGQINFAFPWSVLCYDSTNGNAPFPQRYSPMDINRAVQQPNASGKRYLLLGSLSPVGSFWGLYTLTVASEKSPLDPAVFGTAPGLTPRVAIVPGSERVYGPDQLQGPHYGNRIQYTRVSASAGTIGPNQYKINYADVVNAAVAPAGTPAVMAGYIEFNSGSDGTSFDAYDNAPIAGSIVSPENPVPSLSLNTNTVYRPNGLPEFKYEPLTGRKVPSDPIEITYSFQMNRPNDVVKADYLTRELMNVAINVRYYDPRSSRPQETSLTSQVKVRNLQR